MPAWMEKLKGEFKKQPWYVWAGAASGAGVVIFFLVKERLAATAPAASSASNTASASDPLNGFNLSDMAGLPYGYENNPGSSSGTTDGSQPPPPTTTPPPPPTTPAPGSTYVANGILHYVATGSESFSQIAKKYGLKSWNDIYAIPENQQSFGKMDSTHAAGFVPKSGAIVVLPHIPGVGSGEGPATHQEYGFMPEQVGWL